MKVSINRQIAVLERLNTIGPGALRKEGARAGEIELMKDEVRAAIETLRLFQGHEDAIRECVKARLRQAV